MKIQIVTNDGCLVETIQEDEIGDLDKPFGASSLISDLKVAIKAAKKLEENEF